MSEDKLELMRQMVAQLNQAADAYYDGKAEQMTDYEWDALFDRLKKMEEETGVVSVVLQHRITIAVDNGFYLLAGLTHRALVNGIRSIVVDILLAEQRVNLVACNLVCS